MRTILSIDFAHAQQAVYVSRRPAASSTFDEMPERAERPMMSRDERRVMIESLPIWNHPIG
jgi:hypothetical protein